MKLRRESVENGDFSGAKGEFKNRFSGRNRIEIPSLSENRFLNRKSAVIDARSSWLHAISGLARIFRESRGGERAKERTVAAKKTVISAILPRGLRGSMDYPICLA